MDQKLSGISGFLLQSAAIIEKMHYILDKKLFRFNKNLKNSY